MQNRPLLRMPVPRERERGQENGLGIPDVYLFLFLQGFFGEFTIS
jgi:hypothetical protein